MNENLGLLSNMEEVNRRWNEGILAKRSFINCRYNTFRNVCVYLFVNNKVMIFLLIKIHCIYLYLSNNYMLLFSLFYIQRIISSYHRS